tara:strand:+ start:4613 stop:4786 length:174 start_codon:yes stop_codon:yes gene_type:complete
MKTADEQTGIPHEWHAEDRCISEHIKRVELAVVNEAKAMRADDRVIGLELRPPKVER